MRVSCDSSRCFSFTRAATLRWVDESPGGAEEKMASQLIVAPNSDSNGVRRV